MWYALRSNSLFAIIYSIFYGAEGDAFLNHWATRTLLFLSVLPWKVVLYLVPHLNKHTAPPPETATHGDLVAESIGMKIFTVLALTAISIAVSFVVLLPVRLQQLQCCSCHTARRCHTFLKVRLY